VKLGGNTVLITGGSMGIGLGLAEVFLRAGSEVIVCGRREARLLEAKSRLPGLHIRVCDVVDRDDQKRLHDWTVENFPQLNVLINNAGIQRDIDLTRGVEDILAGESEIAVNLEAPILLTARFVPHLASRPWAAIMNVSSGLIFRPAAGVPIYCATKAALHVYSQLLRQQLADTAVKVFELIPPMVDTELNKAGRDMRNLTYRGITTEEYIETVVEGLKKDLLEIRYSA
jgi:uncharacterized oxidoreductase